jgi:methylated-DNA-[protein]-cysteine S-methyltransferase
MLIYLERSFAMYYTTTYDSPIGLLTLGADDDNLIALWIGEEKYLDYKLLEKMKTQNDLPVFEQTKAWLDRYFAGKRPDISELSLAPIGSDFQQEVWKILITIPYGEVTTYGKIANQIAELQGKKKMSAQAVGGAVGRNPISIIIPCHRVVGSNGSLTGFAGGIDKKVWLLEHEDTNMTNMFIPKKGTAL